jgi:hypothetical protein
MHALSIETLGQFESGRRLDPQDDSQALRGAEARGQLLRALHTASRDAEMFGMSRLAMRHHARLRCLQDSPTPSIREMFPTRHLLILKL